MIKLAQNPQNVNGFIFIERPHQGRAKVWSAADESDLFNIAARIEDTSRSDLSAYDMNTVAGVIDYLRHDLRSLDVLRIADIKNEIENPHLEEAFLSLGWAEEVEDAEEA